MPSNLISTETSLIINQYIKNILKKKKKQVKVVSLIAKTPFIELVEDSLHGYEKMDWSYKVLSKQNGFILSKFLLKRDLYIRKINNNFLALQNGSMLYILTGGSKNFIDSGIMFLAKCLYPNVIIAYITSDEIFELLKYFSKVKETTLFYKSSVRRKMFGEAETDVSYRIGRRQKKAYTFEEAFHRAEMLGQWIDKIHVISERFKYDFYLSRNGMLKIKKGLFEDYFDNLLIKIGEKYLERLKQFEKRSRLIQPEFRIKPLILSFETNIFDDAIVRKQFLNVIEEYQNCSYSVVYAGNPHIYINIVDRLDNSVFSVRTHTSKNIIISPQIKTTDASLMRFNKHLLENFREGKTLALARIHNDN